MSLFKIMIFHKFLQFSRSHCLKHFKMNYQNKLQWSTLRECHIKAEKHLLCGSCLSALTT